MWIFNIGRKLWRIFENNPLKKQILRENLFLEKHLNKYFGIHNSSTIKIHIFFFYQVPTTTTTVTQEMMFWGYNPTDFTKCI